MILKWWAAYSIIQQGHMRFLGWLLLAALVGLVIRRAIGIARAWFALHPPRQDVIALCPGCRVDLVTNLSSCWGETEKVTVFDCPCGEHSTWDFNDPNPVLISSSRQQAVTLRG